MNVDPTLNQKSCSDFSHSPTVSKAKAKPQASGFLKRSASMQDLSFNKIEEVPSIPSQSLAVSPTRQKLKTYRQNLDLLRDYVGDKNARKRRVKAKALNGVALKENERKIKSLGIMIAEIAGSFSFEGSVWKPYKEEAQLLQAISRM